MGEWNKKYKLEEVLEPKTVVSKPSTKIRVKISKVGEKVEDDKGNTTLPIEINNIKSIAILDSGTDVGIVTREIWVSWGNFRRHKSKVM